MTSQNIDSEFTAPRSSSLKKKRKLWKRCLIWAAYFGVISVSAAAGLLIYLKMQALPVTTVLQTSVIYDVEGKVVDRFSAGQNRELVDLKQVSNHMKDAVIAIEDRRFYSHFGLDLNGIARAAAVNLKEMGKVQGASTLTQQLARNLYLSHDRTWSRKMKEAMFALQLEMNFSKDEILEMYLNQIYFGHSTYGVEAAAKLFFGKQAKDLTLAEAAMMAGVPKGAKYYSPHLNMENAKKRQRVVLQAMAEEGFITAAEAKAAADEPLRIVPLVSRSLDEAPYFSDYVKQQAVELLGIDETELNGGGLRIYTTLDLRAQHIAEKAVEQQLRGSDADLQAALVAIDPRTGYIRAMVGGRDYQVNQFNRVFASTRQPGSTFKPVLYLAALQQPDFTAVTRFKSEPTVFTYDNGRQTYTPSNFNDHYTYDFIDLRQAIAKSDNVYAVNTIMSIGAENVMKTAQSLGITSQLKPLPSLALGTFPVSPFEMAAAFGVIASQGVKAEPLAILRIVDGHGRVLYEAEPKAERVVDSKYTFVLTNLMESVFDSGGTGFRVSERIKRPVAGKTGTTNTDSWMIGFTPELSTAVWLGYDRDKKVSAGETRKAAFIFADFIEQTLEPIPPKLFEISEEVVSVYIDPVSGKLAGEGCEATRLEYFVKGTEPTETCTLHDISSGEDFLPMPGDGSAEEDSWWGDFKRWWNE